MKNLLSLFLYLTCLSTLSVAQGIEALKLTREEVPSEYALTESLLCKSIQATILYESPELYAVMLGNVVEKGHQSFEKKGEKGSVLYFVFDKDVTDNALIPGLLWGSADKPTKAHPEEYLAKGNTLVIWSFDKKSPLKKISKEKVAANL